MSKMSVLDRYEHDQPTGKAEAVTFATLDTLTPLLHDLQDLDDDAMREIIVAVRDRVKSIV